MDIPHVKQESIIKLNKKETKEKYNHFKRKEV